MIDSGEVVVWKKNVYTKYGWLSIYVSILNI